MLSNSPTPVTLGIEGDIKSIVVPLRSEGDSQPAGAGNFGEQRSCPTVTLISQNEIRPMATGTSNLGE